MNSYIPLEFCLLKLTLLFGGIELPTLPQASSLRLMMVVSQNSAYPLIDLRFSSLPTVLYLINKITSVIIGIDPSKLVVFDCAVIRVFNFTSVQKT